MVQLRLAPSGPPILGNNPGDILIWNGTTWVVGPNVPGASNIFRSQFENAQVLGGVDADVVGAGVTFLNVPAGAYVFVQSVLNLGTASGSGVCAATAVWDPGSGDDVIWDPGPVIWPADGEGATFAKYPLQFQTPPLGALAASVNVRLVANGTGFIGNGHFQAELILP